MQRNDDAERIIKNVPWSAQKQSQDWFGDVYYHSVNHDAQLLYLLSKHFPNRLAAVPPSTLDAIGKSISEDVNSLSAGYTLLALDAFAKSAASSMKLGISEIAKDGKEKVLTFPASSMPRVNIAEGTAKVQFSKDGPLSAYFVTNESGFDRNSPPPMSQGIEVFREFIDAKGNVITRVKVGEEFFVRVRIRTTNVDQLEQVAVVDLLPGGVEPVLELQPAADSGEGVDPAANPRHQAGFASLPVGIPEKSNWIPDHVDVREDRIVLFGNVTRNQGTFVYRARATNAGTFQSPPAFAEGMYDRKIAGLGMAGKLEIVKP